MILVLTKEEIDIIVDALDCFEAEGFTSDKIYINKVINVRLKLENYGKDISKT